MRAGERFDAAFLLALARKTGRLFRLFLPIRFCSRAVSCLCAQVRSLPGINRRPPRRRRKTSGLLFEAHWFYWGLWGGVAYISAAPKRFLDPSFFNPPKRASESASPNGGTRGSKAGNSCGPTARGNWLHKKERTPEHFRCPLEHFWGCVKAYGQRPGFEADDAKAYLPLTSLSISAAKSSSRFSRPSPLS